MNASSRRTAPATCCAAPTTPTCTSPPTWSSAGSTTSRWREALPRARHGRVRAQVPLRLDGRARRAWSARPSPASTYSARSRSTARSAGSTRWRSRSPLARAPARSGFPPSTRSTSRTSARRPPGAKVPVWVKLQLDLREQGIEIPPVPGRARSDGTVLPELREVLAHDRPAQHGAGHRAPEPGRDLRRGRRRARGRGARHRGHPSRVPLAGPERRGPAERWPTGARCSSAASPRRTPARSPGSAGSRTSAPPGRRTRCCRPTSGRCSTRRSRTGWR